MCWCPLLGLPFVKVWVFSVKRKEEVTDWKVFGRWEGAGDWRRVESWAYYLWRMEEEVNKRDIAVLLDGIESLVLCVQEGIIEGETSKWCDGSEMQMTGPVNLTWGGGGFRLRSLPTLSCFQEEAKISKIIFHGDIWEGLDGYEWWLPNVHLYFPTRWDSVSSSVLL